jgi:hypothetical protein
LDELYHPPHSVPHLWSPSLRLTIGISATQLHPFFQRDIASHHYIVTGSNSGKKPLRNLTITPSTQKTEYVLKIKLPYS